MEGKLYNFDVEKIDHSEFKVMNNKLYSNEKEPSFILFHSEDCKANMLKKIFTKVSSHILGAKMLECDMTKGDEVSKFIDEDKLCFYVNGECLDTFESSFTTHDLILWMLSEDILQNLV